MTNFLRFLAAIALAGMAVVLVTTADIRDTSDIFDPTPTPEPVALRGGTVPVRITSDDAMYVTVDTQILGRTTPVTVLLTEESMHKIQLSAINSNAVHELYIWPKSPFVQTVHLQR